MMGTEQAASIPWYERTYRWGQTNLTEKDPIDCDLGWWKQYWRNTKIQGIIVNAGGIVAFYPSTFEMQYRAQGIAERDLFGEFVTEARKEGLTVLARMDINRATEEFYDAHPDWFVVTADGEPVIKAGRYIACINGPYYKSYIPQVLAEIIAEYQPDGFTDNSWTGVSRTIICHCNYCKEKYQNDSGHALPLTVDWNDPNYKKWIKWSYNCRMENWDLFNSVTKQHGGEDCLWIGMFNADPFNPHTSFCDLKEVGERAKIMMCDHQSRDALSGFEQNSLNGLLLHSLSSDDVLIPESMSNYVRGERAFRQASNPAKETRLWMIEGIAGGISPWYHHVGAVQEDKRQFENVLPVMQWHVQQEAYLYNRRLVANIGIVWNQENTEFYGRDDVEEKVGLPWRGFVRSLIRSRQPFKPVHADHISRDAKQLDVLILPDVAAMTDSQCEAVKQFVEAGGSLVFTGASATLDEWGERRARFPLQSLTGISHLHQMEGAADKQTSDWEHYEAHNYFRLPANRHEVLNGFEQTATVPFGGQLHRVESDGQLEAIATYIPSYPIFPPEFAWARESSTDIPVMFTGTHASGGRIVYFAGDVDRCYGRTHLPDLGDLLANAVKWAVADRALLKIEGPGYLNCKLYRQEGRLIIHLVNLSGVNQYPGYVEQYLPVGPIVVSVHTGDQLLENAKAYLKVGGFTVQPECKNGWSTIQLQQIIDHELIILA